MLKRMILPAVLAASIMLPACTEEPQNAPLSPAAAAPARVPGQSDLADMRPKDLYRFGVESVQELSEQDRAMVRNLGKIVKDAPLQGMQFGEAIEFLRERGDLNINARWPALSAAGIGRDKLLNVSMKNVSVRKCLEESLADVSGGTTANIDYIIRDGIIEISTTENLAKDKGPPKAYNIRDLIKDMPVSNTPVADFLTSASNEERYLKSLDSNRPTREEMINRISNLIQTFVASNSWVDGTGSMTELNGCLIISQIPENHGKILALLKNLREARKLQNYVDAGPLSVAARHKLAAEVKEARLAGKSLKEAMEFIRDQSGLNIHVRWGALKQAGIKPDDKIDVRLSNIPVRKLLEIVLDEVAGQTDSSLGYAIREGVLVISTGDDLANMEQSGASPAAQDDLPKVTAAMQPAVATRPADKPQPQSTVVSGNNAFAVDLYGRLGKAEMGNLFFSPASAHVALSLAYVGAAGKTASQMADVLHLDSKNEKLPEEFQSLMERLNNPAKDDAGVPAYKLTMANRLWIQNGYDLKDKFYNVSRLNFLSGLAELDFANEPASRKAINVWVSQKTRGKIKNLIGEGFIGYLTRLIITNAVYFKAEWCSKFKKEDTKQEDFFTRPDKPVKTDMMHLTARFNYAQTDDLQMIEMPYLRGEMSMAVLLPAQKDGLAKLEKTLTADGVKKLLDKARDAEVIVTFPKFTCEGSFSLGEMLKAMGMVDAFTGELADFTGISETANVAGGLYIDKVVQKAFVVVDEEGTEAAAATGVSGSIFSSAEPEKEKPMIFKADYPFIYLIRHVPTGEILFMGRLSDPTK
ncbi:MAG: serpin family protein [Planctomycetes bacterium]|nr:serpin family protein [Planctomycetota bacterium]